MITVTASRRGLTVRQREEAEFYFADHNIDAIVHGAAHGGDSDLHKIAHDEGMRCEIYPANDVPSNLDNLVLIEADRVHPADQALVRNHTMVNASELLLGFPGLLHEELRSGTWAAIRYARRRKVKVVIIWPDGTVEEDE